ncbi:MAG: hypothetical protein MR335_01665 [Bacilli bacterium]|nr:hypothetical protein [Bacilli bacterium]
MPNYDELVRLEGKYDAYENEKQKYEEMDLEVALVLYLLLLVPGIIYTVHKSKQKRKSKNTTTQYSKGWIRY